MAPASPSITTHLPPFRFELLAQVGQARAGVFHTPHGIIPTPMFMPVGTQSTVKALTWHQVKDLGAAMVLCNAYHCYLRPGHDLVAQAGGLHQWMNWQGPILTDSGGFQVFSLAHLNTMTEEGVTFKSPIDGSKHHITPEVSMAIQNSLGADVIMAFDHCAAYPVTHEKAQEALERTLRWLERCQKSHARPDTQALFPIIQGSTYLDLRTRSVQETLTLMPDAYGYAVGGVSVGEPPEEMHRIMAHTVPLLPQDRPRYLMGVGTPRDLLEGILHGVDLFDCVMPTRIARHGSFFTKEGRKIITNQKFREDFTPLDESCTCFTCQNHSKGYIRHLFKSGEDTGKTLLSIHNLHYLIQWTQQIRSLLLEGRSPSEILHTHTL
ncbi:MAG: tRNA guanosine(34) transglycosylase Tgt [Vampirovibrionales bacterium]